MIAFRPDAAHDRSLFLRRWSIAPECRARAARFNATWQETLRRSLEQRQWTAVIRGRAYLADHFRFLVPRHKHILRKHVITCYLWGEARREDNFCTGYWLCVAIVTVRIRFKLVGKYGTFIKNLILISYRNLNSFYIALFYLNLIQFTYSMLSFSLTLTDLLFPAEEFMRYSGNVIVTFATLLQM